MDVISVSLSTHGIMSCEAFVSPGFREESDSPAPCVAAGLLSSPPSSSGRLGFPDDVSVFHLAGFVLGSLSGFKPPSPSFEAWCAARPGP